MTTYQDDLIPDVRTATNGDAKRDHPHVILPNLLARAAIAHRLSPNDEAAAHAIIAKWADMERSGRLGRMNETTLEGEFLADVFEKVLGYTRFSENLPQWELWPKFGVNGGQADAAIGRFRPGGGDAPRALVELKGPMVNLDRDRASGRTAVDQCFEYLIASPESPWGIVCNLVSFRLYHRAKTKRAFELFTLQELANRNLERFREFHVLFARDHLLPATAAQTPLLDRLLAESEDQQREVGEKLYAYYHDQRVALIEHLCGPPHGKDLDGAIRIAQKLLDRIIFIAFCEDRGLLPERALDRTWREIPPFKRVTNPRWQNFLGLFHTVDKGDPEQGIPPFNGGLFAEDKEVDHLDLHDKRTEFFRTIGDYDFRDEVNVDVLGHIFERSINDLERLRLGGPFGLKAGPAAPTAKMEKSAERKRGGVYYTPPEFTEFIVENTLKPVFRDRVKAVEKARGLTRKEAENPGKPSGKLAAFWKDCFEALRRVRVCDPACGSGAFLIRAYQAFDEEYRDILGHQLYHEDRSGDPLEDEIPDIILRENLYGADLSAEAAEITRLALWIRSARPGKSLADISGNIVCGNSLVRDPAVDRRGMDWQMTFPEVFTGPEPGFDCIIGNPPWERMKVQEREFFDVAAPDIAAAVSAATRRQLIEELADKNPELYQRYQKAKDAAEKTLEEVRTSGRFPLTAVGDINTYAVFAELARTLVAPRGRVGILVPSGIATDMTTKEFFGQLIADQSLVALFDFENKLKIFPDVDGRFKFSVLLFGGSATKARTVDFAFFAHQISDLEDKERHIVLEAEDLRLFNPNTHTCPIFRSRRDAELTKSIYRRVPVLVDETRKKGGNPWGIKFATMFHQTNDAELFHTAEDLAKKGFKQDGAYWKKGRQRFLPLYEAKMIQAYDHRAASVVVDESNWMRQGQTEETSSVQHQNPEFAALPRFWVAEAKVEETHDGQGLKAFLCYKDVTSATNQRTMIAAFIPKAAVVNSAPIILPGDGVKLTAQCCLLANLNSFAYDFVARQKVGGLHLNFFIVEQVPTLPPDAYAARCPWDKRQTLEKWVSDRVLKLTCTANDMVPLAEAAGFDEKVHKWREDERAEIMAELDAAYFILYGIKREDVEYILSTFAGAGKSQEGLFDGLSAAGRILKAYDTLRAPRG